jgi:putative sporulation protein YyaC
MISDLRNRTKVDKEGLVNFLWQIKIQRECAADRLQFVCIGSDRSSGDSLGPLVGTLLAESGYANVIGTLEHPYDAGNIESRLQEIDKGKIIIAIDACLGQALSVGMYAVANIPVHPGRSVGKQLPGVGDYSIAAIVNEEGRNRYRILQHTSLHRVYTMAKEIVAAVTQMFPLI